FAACVLCRLLVTIYTSTIPTANTNSEDAARCIETPPLYGQVQCGILLPSDSAPVTNGGSSDRSPIIAVGSGNDWQTRAKPSNCWIGRLCLSDWGGLSTFLGTHYDKNFLLFDIPIDRVNCQIWQIPFFSLTI